MDLVEENKRIEKELKGKRLICELVFDHKDFDQWRRHLPQGLSAWDYSFVAAAFTVSVGVYEYEQGDYWHTFPCLPTPGDQNKWGKQFERFLDNHENLETFRQLREQGHRFIAPILAHGGIPHYCLPDFFTLVTHNADYEQLSGDFIEFLKTSPTYLQNIDKPVQRFLLYGGEVAEEFVARILDLWQSREIGDGGGTYGLPPRVVDAFGHWYDANRPARQWRQRKKKLPCASLCVKPGDLGVYLYLPRCDDHPEINENVFWKALGKSWAVTSSHEIPLPFADKWDVEVGQTKKSLAGITNSLPVIFFDRETGKAIHDPKHRRLPEHLLAVFLQSSKISPSPSYFEPLPTWPEYQLAVFDLSGEKILRIDEHEFEIRRPFFQVPEDPVVSKCQSKEKIPVFHSIPEIYWEGTANFTLIKDGVNQGSIDINYNDFKLWFDEPGEYSFHLRGPFGQNVHKHFLLIPRLNLQIQPEVWWPMTDRMRFEVSANGFEFLSENNKPQPFTSITPQLNLQAVTESKEFHLVAEAPTFKWRFIGVDGETCEWTSEPLEINVQDLQQIDYPRLVFELANTQSTINISMLGRQGAISAPTGYKSNISKQNTWSFDLREMRDQVIQKGRAEKFDVLLEEINRKQLYRCPVLSVRPYWEVSNFQAEWHKDKMHEIRITWSEHGPLVADRLMLLIPLWRPWKNEIKVHQLSDHNRSSFSWRFNKLCPGRYIVRSVHAPWGCEDWLNAQFINQSVVDVYKESWGEIFCNKYEDGGIENYLECLLAYWYRPELVTYPPQIPKDISADDIRKFLTGFDRINKLEKMRIPRDKSGSLAIFCLHPQATNDALSNVHKFPEIWQKILPSQEILNFVPSLQDKKFIHKIVFQHTMLKTATRSIKAARSIKQEIKQKSLSFPLKSWHKNLTKKQPPADDVIFLCEKFRLFSDEVGPTIRKDFGPILKREYELFKQPYINREAI